MSSVLVELRYCVPVELRYQASAPEKGGTRLVHFRLPTTVSVDLLAVITEGRHVAYTNFSTQVVNRIKLQGTENVSDLFVFC